MDSLEHQGSTATLGLMVVGLKDPWEREGDRQSFRKHLGETLESSMSACMVKLELSHPWALTKHLAVLCLVYVIYVEARGDLGISRDIFFTSWTVES